MSVNSTIKNAITPIISTVQYGTYTGKSTEYCTFRYDKIPDAFGDDSGNEYVISAQVHYLAPLKTNVLTKISQLATAIKGIGTTPTVTDASDSNGQEFVFSFQMVE